MKRLIRLGSKPTKPDPGSQTAVVAQPPPKERKASFLTPLDEDEDYSETSERTETIATDHAPEDPAIGKVTVTVLKAENLKKKNSDGSSSPYCVVQCGSSRKETCVVPKNLNPIWNEQFAFATYKEDTRIEISLFTKDSHKKDQRRFLGQVSLSLQSVTEGIDVEKCEELQKRNEKSHVSGKLYFRLNYKKFDKPQANFQVEEQSDEYQEVDDEDPFETSTQDSQDLPSVRSTKSLSELPKRVTTIKLDDYETIFKVLIVGDVKAGKSALATQIAGNERYVGFPTPKSVVESFLKPVTVNGKNILIKLEDLAGSESYQALSRMYYRGAHGAFIMFDVSSYETFVHLDNWISAVDTYSNNPSPVKVLIGNKSDCDPQIRKTMGVSSTDAQNYALEKGMVYVETSALNNKNVGDAFSAIIKEIVFKEKIMTSSGGGDEQEESVNNPIISLSQSASGLQSISSTPEPDYKDHDSSFTITMMDHCGC